MVVLSGDLECEEEEKHEALEPWKKRAVVKEHGLVWCGG